jgi:hypothetical protein
MTRLLWATRTLYVLAGLAVLAALAVAAISLAPIVTPAKPVAVASVPAFKPGGETALAAAPERNPFDPQGTAWNTVLAGASAPVAPSAKLMGISTLRGLQGVFTSEGFIGVGRPFQDGILARVSDQAVVVRTAQGERRIALDESRRGFADQLRAVTRSGAAPKKKKGLS